MKIENKRRVNTMIDDNNNDLEQGNGGGGNMGRV